MKAYKGFDADLKCRGYQFEINKIHRTKEANCRSNGFHCAENPLDCLTYYPNWEKSVYYIVEAAGDINEDGIDSKVSCTEMKLIKKLSISDFVLESIIYMTVHPYMIWNRYVKKDTAIGNTEAFLIVRGKNPIAKGNKGQVIGLVKECIECHEIEEISFFTIDGNEYIPNQWYSVEGMVQDFED